ncbi:MAG: DUF192 domain-containing protein [Candidatus Nanoarchaeia archaeon]
MGVISVVFPSGESIEAELANTHLKRIVGLSGCKEKKAMLFKFPFSFKWGFWMPNMNYPLKIIYINKNKEIVDIKDAIPLTKDTKTWKRYVPKKGCKYVLETPFEHNVKIGDKLQF